MKVTPVKTQLIRPGSEISLIDLIIDTLPSLHEDSVLAISSKIVALLEGRHVPANETTIDELLLKEADMYLPSSHSKYGYHFTVKDSSLVACAGIDQSNSDGCYVLWPKNSVETANTVRAALQKHYAVKNLGVIIVDSTSTPMRLGTVGMFLGYSGFKALLDYTGTEDLFGREFAYSRLSIANGIAASAVLCMGEATEQTPLCILEDIPHIEFVDANPDEAELACMSSTIEDDLFAPFITKVPWVKP